MSTLIIHVHVGVIFGVFEDVWGFVSIQHLCIKAE